MQPRRVVACRVWLSAASDGAAQATGPAGRACWGSLVWAACLCFQAVLVGRVHGVGWWVGAMVRWATALLARLA